LLDYSFTQNIMNYLSIIKKSAAYFFIIFIICIIPCSCYSQNAVKKKIINTKKEISDGLRKGNIIYFLCEYVLSEPGTTVIPMYMYSPGNIHFDKVFLYAFDISIEKLSFLTELKPVSSHDGRGMIKNAKWDYKDTKIYVTYFTGWDKAAKKYIEDVFSFDLKTNAVNELKDADKEKTLTAIFSKSTSTDIIPMTRIMYYTGYLPHDVWQLPLPTDYSTMNNTEKERVIVEQLGDSYFRDAVFRSIIKTATGKEAERIILSMQEWNANIPKFKQMTYLPYMEEWTARLSITAGLNSKDSQNSIIPANSADFLEAAYTDNIQRLKELLKKSDINTADKNGCTALMYAVFGKAQHTMEILIKNGADRNRKTKSGYTAWMFVSSTELRQRYLALTQK
jgi:hypothetical protein